MRSGGDIEVGRILCWHVDVSAFTSSVLMNEQWEPRFSVMNASDCNTSPDLHVVLPVAIPQAQDFAWVAVLQFGGERALRKVLIAD